MHVYNFKNQIVCVSNVSMYDWCSYLFYVPMHEIQFFQLQSHFPHSEHTKDAGLRAAKMEEAFRVLIESVYRIEHKMDSFDVRMEMVEKSLEELRSKCPVGAPSKQPSDLSPSQTFKSPKLKCLLEKPSQPLTAKIKCLLLVTRTLWSTD